MTRKQIRPNGAKACKPLHLLGVDELLDLLNKFNKEGHTGSAQAVKNQLSRKI